MPRTGPLTKDTSTVALGLAQIRVGAAAANITSTDVALGSAASMGALASTKYTGTVDYWKLESGFPMLEDMTLPLREAAMLEVEFKEITPKNLALAKGIDPSSGQSATVTDGTAVTSSGTTGGGGGITVTDDTGPVSDVWTVVFTDATNYAVYGAATGHVGDGTVSGVFAPDNGGNPYFTIPANFFAGTWAADESFTFTTTEYVATGSYEDAHSGSINLGAITAPDYVRMEAIYTFPNGTNHMYIVFPRANVVSSLEVDFQAEDNANPPLTFEAKRADSQIAGGNVAWDNAPLGRIYFD